jgi:hypothetical protein
MREYRSNAGRWTMSLALAASLAFSTFPVAFAHPGDVNSVNDGHNVAGGTYYNTEAGQTTFVNSGHTGLHLNASDTVVGREVSSSTGLETGNGGNLFFNAHGQVVQLDGNINVSGFMKNGTLGNGGNVTIDAGALYQNGQIFANGANGGIVQMNVSGMTMGPNARIEARGLEGAGGVVGINATGAVNVPQGAVIDSSGAVIGTYNTNVIQVKGGIVNLDGVLQANGLNPGDAGGKVAIYATDSLNIGPNGQVLANGADGFSGYNPTNGGNGGLVLVSAEKNLSNNGLIAANGGNGGTNPDVINGPVSEDGYGGHQQVSLGQNGANGGNGGQVEVYFKGQMTNDGAIEVKGGNGGDGQQAYASEHGVHQIASGGDGGAGGDGGFVKFFGNPSQAVLNNLNYQGGSGGQGGTAATASSCGCATPGVAGACGKPGGYSVTPYSPPPTPPTPPLYPPYPREYSRLGDTLPGAAGQVLNYNRSIFLARAPLPVIKKKDAPPVVVPVAPPAPKQVTPKPVPKRVPVRGYW